MIYHFNLNWEEHWVSGEAYTQLPSLGSMHAQLQELTAAVTIFTVW